MNRQESKKLFYAKQHRLDIGSIVHNKVIQCCQKASVHLKQRLQDKPHECYLLVPSILISYWMEYLERIEGHFKIEPVSFRFMGWNITPGFRNEIVIYHPKSAEIGDDTFVSIVSLSTDTCCGRCDGVNDVCIVDRKPEPEESQEDILKDLLSTYDYNGSLEAVMREFTIQRRKE